MTDAYGLELWSGADLQAEQAERERRVEIYREQLERNGCIDYLGVHLEVAS